MSYRYFLLLILYSVSSALLASENNYEFEWSLLKTEDNIRIYTSDVQGSKYKAVKAEMVLRSSLQNFVGLTQDVTACPTWAHLCKHSRIHERKSDDAYVVYTINDLPWPIADREVLVDMSWTQNPNTLEVEIKSHALSTELPMKDNVVQIKKAVSNWYLKPRDRKSIMVISEAYIEHEKNIPGWAANDSAVESMLNTFRNLRDLLQGKGYVPPAIDFRIKDIVP